ncbi:MAG: hypothetical protein JXR63_07615 [Spirochaetales bacterium]|nr:hypothetical protein [Spirochaetales bacterium]
MKKYLFILVCLLGFAGAFAQQHYSVPVNEPIYYMLEVAQIKGYCSRMPATKPYSVNQILAAIEEIQKSGKGLDAYELEVILHFKKKYEIPENGWSWQRGSYSNSGYLEKKDIPAEEKNLYSFETGVRWTSDLRINMASPHEFSTINFLDVFIRGDMSKYFSYNFQFSPGFYQVDTGAFDPFTFTKQWDGAVFPPSALADFKTHPDVFSFGFFVDSEIDLSFFENKLNLRFGRVRHDWGVTGGSLLLHNQARPFVAIEGFAQPTPWLKFSFLTGVLEYEYTSSIRDDAMEEQKAVSMALLELDATKWFYFNFGGGVIWPKRFELGYLMPNNINYFYQNVVGDFDNLSLTSTIMFCVPGYANFYFSAYIDEMNLLVDDFLNKDRNMYSLQGGVKFAIPKIPFSLLTIQYTKIEPYCYTNPKRETPWYDYDVHMNYTNNGENLGYALKPNSDELMFKFETMPYPGVKANLSYRMIRHGFVDGSEFSSEMDYSMDLNGAPEGSLLWKDFLKDGVYEWFHELGIGATTDFSIMNVPITLGLGYTFVYKYHTDYVGGQLQRINTADYADKSNHLFSIYFKVF